MRQCTDADIAILNSGTLRSDTVHPKGPFKVKDLMSILPMCDPMVVLKCKGITLKKTFEQTSTRPGTPALTQFLYKLFFIIHVYLDSF